MAGPFDSTIKRIIREYGEDFTRWLDAEATFEQALDIELQSQHIFADALLRVNKRNRPSLLHIEVQTSKDPDMEVRLLEYNVLASHQYNHLPVYSYVIYLRDVGDVKGPPYIRRFPDDEEGEEVHRFNYRVIQVAELPAQDMLELDWQGLLPFVLLAKGGKQPDVVQTMIDRLAEKRDVSLLEMAWIIGGSVFKQEVEREWFRRRFTVFQDIFQDSWVYQEMTQTSFEKGLAKGMEVGLEQGLEQGLEKGLEQGLERGLEKGLYQGILSFLQVRFPEMLALANQQISSVKSSAVLQALLNQLFTAQTPEQAKQILLDINKQ